MSFSISSIKPAQYIENGGNEIENDATVPVTHQMDGPNAIQVGVAGAVSGVRAVIAVISFGALIFSGSLSPFVASGLGLALLSTVIIGVVVALMSTYKGSIAICQDQTSAIMALAAASIAASLPASTPDGVVFSTVVGCMVVTTLLTGILFMTLGIARLGGLIRFIPFPVIGGFVAGSGWLLVVGSFSVMLDQPLKLFELGRLLEPGWPLKWVPGLLLGCLLMYVFKRLKHSLAIPLLLIGAVGIFYMGLLGAGFPIHEAQLQGLLLGPFPEGSLWPGLAAGYLVDTDWMAIAHVAPNIATIAMISVVALLLYASGIELEVGQDLRLNKELRAAGVANLLAGATGGLVGFHALSLTALSHRMRAPSRWTGLISAGICAAALFFGASILHFVPRSILGGLILFIGLDFLYEWLVEGWRKLPRSEYLIVWFILVTVAVFGFLQGILAGIVAGVALFVVNYSRINVVQYELSGALYRSNVERSDAQRKVLRKHGARIQALKLHGFIFFGTANNLFKQVRQRAWRKDLPKLMSVLLDFHQVSGLDSSAVMSFIRMQQFAKANGFTLGLVNTREDILTQLTSGGFKTNPSEAGQLFDDLDHGLERCEDAILLEVLGYLQVEHFRLSDRLRELFPETANVDDFMRYLEEMKVESNGRLIRQDEPSDDLFFVESGRVTASLVLEDGKEVRLRTMGPGTVVGEIGFYLNVPRTASVIAEGDVHALRLSRDALRRMEADSPATASAFHEFIVRLLAERLAETNKTLNAVLD